MSQITPVNSNCNKSKKPQSPSETNKANNKSHCLNILIILISKNIRRSLKIR